MVYEIISHIWAGFHPLYTRKQPGGPFFHCSDRPGKIDPLHLKHFFLIYSKQFHSSLLKTCASIDFSKGRFFHSRWAAIFQWGSSLKALVGGEVKSNLEFLSMVVSGSRKRW